MFLNLLLLIMGDARITQFRLENSPRVEERTSIMFIDLMTPKYTFNINFTVEIINPVEWAMNSHCENLLDQNTLVHRRPKNERGTGAGYTVRVIIWNMPMSEFEQDYYFLSMYYVYHNRSKH